MPDVPKDHVMRPDQRPMPIVWMVGPVRLPLVPDVSDAALELVFGPGTSRRLKSWGHDDEGVHWLSTRSGTSMHTDVAYSRYTHHLLLRNDGYRLRGWVDAERHPVLVPGMMYCLDTHSPHQVVPDDRMEPETGRPVYKVQVAVDRDEPLTQAEAWGLMARRLRDDPKRDADKAKFVAPRFKKSQ